MTTTACDDQFSAEPEPAHQPYDVAAILRRNIADLEKELQRQKERAETALAELLATRDDNHRMMEEIFGLRERAHAAEMELKAAREQKPVAHVKYKQTGGNVGLSWMAIPTDEFYPREMEALYVSPIPAPAVPAPEIPDGDDFNGTTPHLIQCIEALVRLNDRGVLVPHGIWGHARTLLLASANRLRQQPAPVVPEEWRKVMAELADDLAIEIDQNYQPERSAYPSEQRKYAGEMVIVHRARALLQSAGGGK